MNKQINKMKDEEDEITLHLESLRSEYNNLLIRYKQAVTDYINNLKLEASNPCTGYTGDSKNISQECYNYIWERGGCNTQASSGWFSTWSLNELIKDTFLWATLTDETHRKGCYGIYVSPFIILRIDPETGKFMIGRNSGLETEFDIVNDNSGTGEFKVVQLATGYDGKMILGVSIEKRVFYKSSWDSPEWKPITHDCCVSSVAMGQDGTLVGVGTDNRLWSKTGLNELWLQTTSPDEWVSYVCIAPDGSIFVISTYSSIWRKDSYQNLSSQSWVQLAVSDFVLSSITIANDGTFIGVRESTGELWIKDSYKDLSTPWKGPYGKPYTGPIITTIENPDYSSSTTQFSKATNPNFNINSASLMEIPGQAFWGESSVGNSGSTTLQECSASCSSTVGCTGATYNSNTQSCNLRGGTGSAIPSSDTDYAIVPKSQQLLKIVNSINSDLTGLNKEIEEEIRKIKNLYTDEANLRSSKNTVLINQYKNLQTERERIKEVVNQYQTLENAESETNIYILQKYYVYFLLLALAVISIIVMYKITIKTDSGSGATGGENSFSISTVKTTMNNISKVNPFYVLFCIILVVIFIYFYNRYFRAI